MTTFGAITTANYSTSIHIDEYQVSDMASDAWEMAFGVDRIQWSRFQSRGIREVARIARENDDHDLVSRAERALARRR